MAMRKTKSGHGSDCGFGGGFSEKKESRNISLHSFFSHRHNDDSQCNDSIRLSQHIHCNDCSNLVIISDRRKRAF